jgi:hypothetical protein
MLLFEGNKKVYVGVEHGKKPSLSAQDMAQIKAIADKHGAWFEGDGGDVGAIKLPRKDFRGSWDGKLEQKVQGYPHEFLYTIFTNVDANKQAEKLTNSSNTILQSIVKAQDSVGFLKNKKFSESTVNQFLRAVSEDGVDFAEMAKKPATPEAVAEFLAAGERLMWPDNWNEYPNKAGKIAKKVNDQRQNVLLEQSAGVYFVGSDHIKDLKNKLKTKNMSGMQPRQAKRSLLAGARINKED